MHAMTRQSHTELAMRLIFYYSYEKTIPKEVLIPLTDRIEDFDAV